MRYKIITDSSSDMLSVTENCCYSSVPLKIITDNTEYVDDKNLNVNEMISDLQKYKGTSKSSCPNLEDWKEAFEDYECVFCVTITSGLSGSYNAAVLAMNEYLSEHPDRKGAVLDSLSTGPENALIIEKLIELISLDLPFDEIEKQVREYMKQTHLIFCLDSLRNLANNGRVNKAVAKVVGLLGIRILGIASNQGTLEITNKVRGAEKAYAEIHKILLEKGYKGGKIRIHHCQNEAAANIVSASVKRDFPNVSVVIQSTGALCSFYAESGGLLVGFEGSEK